MLSTDPQIPFLAVALNPSEMRPYLAEAFCGNARSRSRIRVLSAEMIRHKPARRCLIQYEIEITDKDQEEILLLLGKIRSKGLGRTHLLMQALRDSGFDDESDDGVSVPEVLGSIPELHMWMQRKVSGKVLTGLLSPVDSSRLGERVAGALNKLHHAGIPAPNKHTIAEELKILKQYLDSAKHTNSSISNRIEIIYRNCERIASRITERFCRGIHRDFYQDQILITEDGRVYLLDLDLYCEGHPALDAGNFLAHLKEQSLRTYGRADAFQQIEHQFASSFLLFETANEQEIRIFTLLALARHIYLSMRLKGRSKLTEKLIEISEQHVAGLL